MLTYDATKGKVSGALLTDLSKAFYCLSYEMINTEAFGLSPKKQKLMHSYVSNKKQRTKVNHVNSSWEEILLGVSQSSILGPMLFNFFLTGLSHVINDTDFSVYADDKTIYSFGNSIDEVILLLQELLEQLFKWFSEKQMKAI